MWSQLGQPAALRLVELGPGRGTLIADALRAIAKAAPAFGRAIELHLVETSPALRTRQATTLDLQKVGPGAFRPLSPAELEAAAVYARRAGGPAARTMAR